MNDRDLTGRSNPGQINHVQFHHAIEIKIIL